MLLLLEETDALQTGDRAKSLEIGKSAWNREICLESGNLLEISLTARGSAGGLDYREKA